MKNFKLTVFTLILSTTTLFAQIGDSEMSDKWIVTDFEKTLVETDDNEKFTTKHFEITEEFTPVMLDPKDKYKLNQDIIYLPTQVKKIIKLDYDKDILYDKKVEFNYKKSENTDLDFTLSKTGIIITTDNTDISVSKIWNKFDNKTYSNAKNNRIKKEGTYVIKLSNNEEIDITITNYNIF